MGVGAREVGQREVICPYCNTHLDWVSGFDGEDGTLETHLFFCDKLIHVEQRTFEDLINEWFLGEQRFGDQPALTKLIGQARLWRKD